MWHLHCDLSHLAKRKTLLAVLAGVNFFLKKERVFFFRGSAIQVFGQCWGFNTDCKTFSGERIFQNFRLICFHRLRRKIRYEEKSSISVDCFVLQHHPDNVHHLPAEADECLALALAL